jgi:hypothetical protein
MHSDTSGLWLKLTHRRCSVGAGAGNYHTQVQGVHRRLAGAAEGNNPPVVVVDLPVAVSEDGE